MAKPPDVVFARRAGLRLVRMREQREWSQTKVANHLLISQPALSNYERGARVLPLDVTLRACHLFGVSVEDVATHADLP